MRSGGPPGQATAHQMTGQENHHPALRGWRGGGQIKTRRGRQGRGCVGRSIAGGERRGREAAVTPTSPPPHHGGYVGEPLTSCPLTVSAVHPSSGISWKGHPHKRLSAGICPVHQEIFKNRKRKIVNKTNKNIPKTTKARIFIG